MKGITVSVDYDDVLEVTLPRNAKHFEEVVVVTAPQDRATQRVVATVPNARCYVTDAFYRRGAHFNKGLSMELGLDELGRSGWIVIWDADTLMPPVMDLTGITPGNLYTPKRRVLEDVTAWHEELDWQTLRRPEEEFAGYFQLFHADDPVLRIRPWYGIDWKHAGGCDSVFHQRWPDANKIRPDFEVLHIGLDGQNWCGRATRKRDGTLPPQAAVRRAQLQKFLSERRRYGYRHEKLP